MKEELIFDIENISCYYEEMTTGIPKKVLHIHELHIPRGKLLAIVGLSGSGKSTFLETIGLMNKTILKEINAGNDGQMMFLPIKAPKPYDLSDPNLWEPGNKEIEEIRKSYYSFIFQNTNLMPNFSVIENVLISDLILNASYPNAYVTALIFLYKVGLGYLKISQSPLNISGGEKQRVAFARAIVPNFEVLFGDEPTGNLDPTTAKEIMSILKNYINSQHKSAIIVTHDLNLASRFADMIMVLNKKKNATVGEIKNENVFLRAVNPSKLDFNFKQELQNVLNNVVITKKDIETTIEQLREEEIKKNKEQKESDPSLKEPKESDKTEISFKGGNTLTIKKNTKIDSYIEQDISIRQLLEALNSKFFQQKLSVFMENYEGIIDDDKWVKFSDGTEEGRHMTSKELKENLIELFQK